MKKFLSLILVLAVFSCGFKSLSSEINKLPAIKVDVNKNDPIAFILKEGIEDIINSEEKNNYRHNLNISYDFTQSSVSLNSGGSPNRILIKMKTNYELIDKEDNKSLAKGILTSNDIVVLEDNKFANYKSKEFAKENLARNCARRIVNYLIKDL
jgi:hypothetical protein